MEPQHEAAARDAHVGRRVRQRPGAPPAGLTERELEVLLALARGGSNRKIAEDLGISAKTVGHHVQNLYEKAGVHSRAAATLWASSTASFARSTNQGAETSTIITEHPNAAISTRGTSSGRWPPADTPAPPRPLLVQGFRR